MENLGMVTRSRMTGTRGVLTAAAAAMVVGGLLLGGLAGCETTGGGPIGGRPMVADSAVESTWDGASALDFFDSLEGKPLVCHDEVIHGALLLAMGTSAEGYAGRVGLARKMGYIDSRFDRPAREAATIGEVSKVLVRVTDGPRSPGVGAGLTQDAAIQRLAARGWLPGNAKAFQGLSGAQFLTLLSGATESMAGHRATEPAEAPAAKVEEGPANASDGAPISSSANREVAPVVPEAETPAEVPVSAVLVVKTVGTADSQAVGQASVQAAETVPAAMPASKKWVPGRPLKKSN